MVQQYWLSCQRDQVGSQSSDFDYCPRFVSHYLRTPVVILGCRLLHVRSGLLCLVHDHELHTCERNRRFSSVVRSVNPTIVHCPVKIRHQNRPKTSKSHKITSSRRFGLTSGVIRPSAVTDVASIVARPVPLETMPPCSQIIRQMT